MRNNHCTYVTWYYAQGKSFIYYNQFKNAKLTSSQVNNKIPSSVCIIVQKEKRSNFSYLNRELETVVIMMMFNYVATMHNIKREIIVSNNCTCA